MRVFRFQEHFNKRERFVTRAITHQANKPLKEDQAEALLRMAY